MACSICSHKQKAEIEKDLLEVSSEHPVSEIAEKYGVSEQELVVHSVSCIPKEEREPASISQKIKMKEANILEDTLNDYSKTLKDLGCKIRGYINNEDDLALPKLLTKPIAETYVNLGGEIRQSVKTLAELDQMLNGKADNGLNGLESLARALQGSK